MLFLFSTIIASLSKYLIHQERCENIPSLNAVCGAAEGSMLFLCSAVSPLRVPVCCVLRVT